MVKGHSLIKHPRHRIGTKGEGWDGNDAKLTLMTERARHGKGGMEGSRGLTKPKNLKDTTPTAIHSSGVTHPPPPPPPPPCASTTAKLSPCDGRGKKRPAARHPARILTPLTARDRFSQKASAKCCPGHSFAISSGDAAFGHTRITRSLFPHGVRDQFSQMASAKRCPGHSSPIVGKDAAPCITVRPADSWPGRFRLSCAVRQCQRSGRRQSSRSPQVTGHTADGADWMAMRSHAPMPSRAQQHCTRPAQPPRQVHQRRHQHTKDKARRAPRVTFAWCAGSGRSQPPHRAQWPLPLLTGACPEAFPREVSSLLGRSGAAPDAAGPAARPGTPAAPQRLGRHPAGAAPPPPRPPPPLRLPALDKTALMTRSCSAAEAPQKKDHTKASSLFMRRHSTGLDRGRVAHGCVAWTNYAWHGCVASALALHALQWMARGEQVQGQRAKS